MSEHECYICHQPTDPDATGLATEIAHEVPGAGYVVYVHDGCAADEYRDRVRDRDHNWHR